MLKALVVCLLNISEANQAVIEKIAQAACGTATSSCLKEEFKCASTVLNIFSDQDYNRSVLTIAAPVEQVAKSVTTACKVAYQEIDLREHYGGHPRLGAVDLVPIYPISPSVSLDQCGKIAQEIGRQITRNTPGTSIFFFGTADQPKQRSLVERRKEVGWYKGQHGSSYDVGFDLGVAPIPRYGSTGVGASPYVMNCNVTIETDDIVVGRGIAKMIRASSDGGLRGVQAMAFEHEGNIEIACNVETWVGYKSQPMEDQIQPSALQYTSPAEIRERVENLASKYNISVANEATVVGFTPNEVYNMAFKALSEGNPTAWRTVQQHRM